MATPSNKLTPDPASGTNAADSTASDAAARGVTDTTAVDGVAADTTAQDSMPAHTAGSGNTPADATAGDTMTTAQDTAAALTAARKPQPASPAAAYKVQIPLYEGPLDLLLDLIRQQKMSIHDIQISAITAQYLDYLHKLEELNVDVSAEFIYMAATLIYIKSKMLLPPDPLATEDEQNTDPRSDLVQRLVEHEKFKNAAALLYQKQQIEENVWSKPDKSLYNDEGTEGELVVSLVDLVRVFQQVLERRREVARIELHHEQFTVAQMIAALRAQIVASAENAVNLVEFFEACPSRHAMIVAFLAVLEMVKLQAVLLAQEKQFGDIVVKRGKAFDVAFDESGALRMVDEEYK